MLLFKLLKETKNGAFKRHSLLYKLPEAIHKFAAQLLFNLCVIAASLWVECYKHTLAAQSLLIFVIPPLISYSIVVQGATQQLDERCVECHTATMLL